MSANLPHVSVVVCTRNRGASVTDPVRTLLRNDYPNFELIVVDQSTNTETAAALAAFANDKRLHYVNSSSNGVSVAHNLGLHLVHNELVLATDDDCEVPSNWIRSMVAALQRDERIGLIYCNVLAASHDPVAGFIPTSIARDSFLIDGPKTWRHDAGIGAGMGYRRSALRQIGGFENMVGPGSRFRSGNDIDLSLRMMLLGYHVYHDAEIEVLHHGFVPMEQMRNKVTAWMCGTGAIYAKLLKCRPAHIAPIWLSAFYDVTLNIGVQQIKSGRAPKIARRTLALLQGFRDGLRTPVDCRTLRFREL